MRKKTTLYLLCILISRVSYGNVTISGYITDKQTGETLINASVYDHISGKGAVSNTYGFYSLTLPSGESSLQYSYVGFKTQNIKAKVLKDTTINVRMAEATELSEITILSERNKESGVHGSQMSAIQIPVSQIKSIPALFGETDVIKALQLLPGVKAGTEGSAGLYVRGGGPDENLLLLDGIPVYNVNHMFGFFSVFNSDAIKNVTLYKGDFPARFGGRLSSVVDIHMNDGNDNAFHGNATIGLISSKINLEGPIIKEKTTFNFSFRRTYADILAQPIIKYEANRNGGNANSTAGYYFYDLNTKISHKISEKDRLSLSIYSGDDVIYTNLTNKNKSSINTRETSRLKMDWNWGNLISALRWNHVINSKLFMNTTASYTRYRFNMGIGTTSKTTESDTSSVKTENISMDYRSGIEDISLKADLDYTPMAGHDIKFGGNYIYHTFRPGVSVEKANSTGENAQHLETTIGDKNIFSHEIMFYAEDNINISSFIKTNIGLHYSAFNVQQQFYNSLQPRMSVRLLINDNLSFKAGYASMSQYIHLLSNNSISLPTDIWVPVTKRITPMKSRQISAGFFYNLMDYADLSLEGYYKTMNNLIEYKDGASFMGSNTGWEDKVSMGRGWAYGIEFLAQKSYGKTTGLLGYTWSKSERLFDRTGQEINYGKVFPAKYDRRHDASLTIAHKFSERFDLSGTWVYSTGNCGTLAMQSYQGSPVPQDPEYYPTTLSYISTRNNYRLNAYHRMDIGINFHKKLKHGIRTWNISFYNAYNQQNPFMVYPNTTGYYDQETKKYKERKTLRQVSLLPILPSISYNYKF